MFSKGTVMWCSAEAMYCRVLRRKSSVMVSIGGTMNIYATICKAVAFAWTGLILLAFTIELTDIWIKEGCKGVQDFLQPFSLRSIVTMLMFMPGAWLFWLSERLQNKDTDQ